jgi:glycosyltransferase involved in cell wall biosynthesis
VLCGDAEAYLAGFAADNAAEKADAPRPESVAEEEATMLAAQDRYMPPSTKNRKNRPLNILYYSPYPSHPANHGNRSTIQHFGRIFRQKGCKAHFALLGLDRHDTVALQAMREAWDSLTILPYPFQDNSYRGEDIAYDGWYKPGLGEHIAYLCALHDIDLLFCSYVFQSRMLEFAPSRVVKVIDTHDKMGGRYAAQRARGLKTEFFSCTPEDEGRYLRRADIVVARRDEEARYFNEVSKRDTAIVIPHVEPAQFLERRFTQLRSVGLVASANKINLDLVTDFLGALAAKTHNSPPFSVRIAGQVANMLNDVPQAKRQVFAQPWVQLLGFVEDIGGFYASVDLIVSPVFFGTGINVKTVQAMSYGMPLVTTECGGKGIETGHPMHLCGTMEDVVENVLRLATRPELLQELAACSRERYKTFYNTSLAGFDFLLDACRNSR